MLVKDHTATEVVTLPPDMEILRAAQVLISCDISGAPVLDRHGRLIGILTERDCVKVALHAGYHGHPGGVVRDYMTSEPEWVRPDATILELAEKFISGKYRRYPVLDGGRLVGVISRRDVMRAMGHHYPG
jgi:CBS domain-containing protein